MLGLPYPPIRARARYDLPKREFAITLLSLRHVNAVEVVARPAAAASPKNSLKPD